MALKKTDIIDKITEKNAFNKAQATIAVEALVEIIKSTLASGEDVMVSGFGKFCVKQKAPRNGRNPATGQTMMLEARKVITFKCSGKLRDKLNGHKSRKNRRKPA
jgi:integration host factor subunit alpha